MTKLARQKITFAEMRATGVRGLLIYCSDFRCSHSTAISGTDGPMTFGYPILKRDLFAGLATRRAPTSGRLSAGKKGPDARRLRRLRACSVMCEFNFRQAQRWSFFAI
jgi:hypothetical protein